MFIIHFQCVHVFLWYELSSVFDLSKIFCGSISHIFDTWVLQYFSNMRDTLVSLDVFIELVWDSPNATRRSCPYGLWIHGFRPIWSFLIVSVLSKRTKFLEISGYCLLINCAFTFHTRIGFFSGFQNVHWVKQCKTCQRTNYQPQGVIFYLWTASIMWYTCRTRARTKISQDFSLICVNINRNININIIIVSYDLFG